jgi:hypothetical protein
MHAVSANIELGVYRHNIEEAVTMQTELDD